MAFADFAMIYNSVGMISNSLPGDITNRLICGRMLKVSFFQVLAKCLDISKPNDLHEECMCADHLQDINKTHTLLKRRFSTQKREVVMEDNDYAKVLER